MRINWKLCLEFTEEMKEVIYQIEQLETYPLRNFFPASKGQSTISIIELIQEMYRLKEGTMEIMELVTESIETYIYQRIALDINLAREFGMGGKSSYQIVELNSNEEMGGTR